MLTNAFKQTSLPLLQAVLSDCRYTVEVAVDSLTSTSTAADAGSIGTIEQARRSSSEPELTEGYQEWRSRFAAERLRVLYYLGLVANPVFIAADVLLYREHLHTLLVI